MTATSTIAKHIPTKRELKRKVYDIALRPERHCKAHPDEKGIETDVLMSDRQPPFYCKAHPDEKGIETEAIRKAAGHEHRIAKHIPTKRELKHKGYRGILHGNG